MRNLWTEQELALLEKYSRGELSLSEVSKQTGRTFSAIQGKAHMTGLIKTCLNRKLPEEKVRQVLDMYKEGISQVQIEKETGLSYHQVRRCLTREGFPRRKQARVLSEEERCTIETLYLQGKPITAIRKTLGCGNDHVLEVIEKLPDRSPKMVFPDDEISEVVQGCTTRMLSAEEVAIQKGCSRYTITRTLREAGVDIRLWLRKKQSAKSKGHHRTPHKQYDHLGPQVVQLYRDGWGVREIMHTMHIKTPIISRLLRDAGLDPLKIGAKRAAETRRILGKNIPSYKCSFGIKTPYKTPFQGVKVLRSSTEATRALELDVLGVAWFYECITYPLGQTTYTPDFWVTDVPLNEARGILGDSPDKRSIAEFLSKRKTVVEDVKGWFGEKHRSYEKINLFINKYRGLPFRVLVIDPKKGVTVWE